MTEQEKLAALNRILERCRNAPFYRDRIPDRPLRSLSELKRVPLTTKEDLRRHSPYGLLAVPPSELFQYHETTGTTGAPVSVWLTAEDFGDGVEEMWRSGVRFDERDRVLIRYPYALSSVAHMLHAAAQTNRACVIPAGGRTVVTPFPRVVDLLRKLDVTVLACLSLQAVMIADTAESMGLRPNRDFPHLRAICTAGEPLSAERRRLLGDIWGVPVFDSYGTTEAGTMAVDCEHGQLHLLEDHFIVELLKDDLETEAAPPGRSAMSPLPA